MNQLSDISHALPDVEGLSSVVSQLGQPAQSFSVAYDKIMYSAGLIPLPKNLRAWHVANRYREVCGKGESS